MVCDLDGFKQINDRFGHLAGDNALRLFANLMRQGCRETDYIARMGGDEFALVAPNMPPTSVRERALLLSAMAQQAGKEICGEDLLSLSVGTAVYPHDGSDAAKLLAEADKKMNTAKRLHYSSHDFETFEAAPHLPLTLVN